MIILLVIGGTILVALARGGKLMNLSFLRFRFPGFILFGFLIVLVVFQKFWQENDQLRPLSPIAYLVSLSLLLIGVTLNHRVAGVKLVLLGFILNFLAIAVNGGYMPVLPSAREISGQSHLAPGETWHNLVAIGPDTRLVFLGDQFAIPKGWPFPNVFSPGDILIAIGGSYLVYKAMTAPPHA
jgi:hypothetical protein